MKYTFDTEFIIRGSAIDFLSIGIVNIDNGKTLYNVVNSYDVSGSDPNIVFVRDHVVPYLHLDDNKRTYSIEEIQDNIRDFFKGDSNIEFYIYVGSFDFVVLCNLFGGMSNLPEGFPNYFIDIKGMVLFRKDYKKIEQTSIKHNALNDALYNALLLKDIYKYDYLQQYPYLVGGVHGST